MKITLSLICVFICLSCSNDLSVALNNHKNDEGIEDIRLFLREREFDRALYNSALLGYSDIVSALVKKSNVDINETGIDGTTSLILACRDKNIEAAKILFENGADISIVDNNGKKAFDYIINKNNIIYIVSGKSKIENAEVSYKFANMNFENDDINMLLEDITKKVIDEMNDMLKKEYKDKEAAKVKSGYEFNDLKRADTISFDLLENKEYTDNLIKVGDSFYYIFSVGVPVDSGIQKKYLDSYTSIWLIRGPLSIALFGKSYAYFVGGFNGLPLSDDINIVSKGDYFTLEDYTYFERNKYTLKYYTFKLEDGIFYLNQISSIDHNNKTSTIYKYNSQDALRVIIDDISYSFANALIGDNYYGK